MSYSSIIQKTLDFVRTFYQKEVSDTFVYHSFQHTLEVLENSILIAKETGLSESEIELVSLAALFHDSGHSGGFLNHEERSAELAMTFLEDSELTNEQKDVICEAIRATKVPQNPKSTIARVLCDADLMYLATESFIETAKLLLQEWRATGQSQMSLKKFYERSTDFLNKHRYHTVYGRTVLEVTKNENKIKLNLLLKDL